MSCCNPCGCAWRIIDTSKPTEVEPEQPVLEPELPEHEPSVIMEEPAFF